MHHGVRWGRRLTIVALCLVGPVVGAPAGSAGAASPKCPESSRLRPPETMTVVNDLPAPVEVTIRDYSCKGWRWPAGPTQFDGTVRAGKYRVLTVEPVPSRRSERTDFTVEFRVQGDVVAAARVGWREGPDADRIAQLVGTPTLTPVTIAGQTVNPKVAVTYGSALYNMVISVSGA